MRRVERAHGRQNALCAIFVGLVRVATTFALTADFFAFAVRQMTHQLVDATPLPIGHDAGECFGFGHQRFADRFTPIARVADFRHRANVAASRAIVRAAGSLFAVDVEAAFFAVAFAAASFETAVAALFGYFETGRSGHQIGRQSTLNVQLAVALQTVGDVFQRVPQTLAPFVELAERFALGFSFLDAGSAFFVGSVGMTATFALTVFVETVHFGQTFGEFAQTFAAPVGQVGAVGAIFQSCE